MILGCYREMPVLCLRVEQAARLFGVSVRTCNVVLPELVRQGRLRLDSDRQYRLGNPGHFAAAVRLDNEGSPRPPLQR